MNMSVVHVDGAQGEGGGQILRSSLALSLVTGRPFVIENIRANRRKPGLMRQHLAAVQAAAEVGAAEVQGAKPVWYDYELIIWEIGETFRQIIKRQKKFWA